MAGDQDRISAGEEKPGLFARIRTHSINFLKSRAGRGAVPALAAIGAGFLFARTPLVFGAYPLGIAVLCAGRRQTLPCFLGVVLGASTMGLGGIVWGVLYMAALLLRLLMSVPQNKVKFLPACREVFGEGVQLRVVSSLVVAAAAAAYELVVSQFDRETLLFALGMVIAAPVLTALFSGVYAWGVTTEDLLGRRRAHISPHSRGERIWLEASTLGLLFFVAFSVRAVSLFGLNIGYLFSSLAALYIARRFGALRGCVTGLVVSMAISTVYAPAFGFLGLLTGTLWPLGAVYALGLGAAAGTIWASYVGGLSGFLGVAPEVWVAALISLPLLPRLYSDAIAEEVQRERAVAEDAVRVVAERHESDDRLSRLSEGFDALSHAFSGTRPAPDVDVCRSICDDICTGYCAACPSRAGCWEGEDRPAAVALETAAAHIAAGRQLTAGDFPTRLIAECTCLDGMLADLRLAGARLWCRTAGAAADYPAPDYALTAELLREAASAARDDRSGDAAAANAIRRRLAEAGIRPAAVSVSGRRLRRLIIGSNAISGKQREVMSMVGTFEEICGCRLSPPVFETDNGVITMETHTTERFDIEVAFATRTATGSEVSGDTVGIFRAKDGYAYLLLADGMGTGRRAARTSNACAVFLEKMLSAGNSDETSLKLLNRMVTMREEECSASVDLLTLDLCYGRACFMKSGAAASYIRREGNLFRMRSRTVPIGIIDEVDAERTAFETREGDVIIMLSDGVSQTSEDAPWLIELLSHPLGNNLNTAAENILDKTVAHGGCGDDMTVILARVKKL